MRFVVLPGRRAPGVIVRIQLLLVIALLAAPALAHETLHQVVTGKGIAVRAYEPDGDPLAQTAFEVYSPAEPKRAWTTGLTDREGWLAFVPNAPGRWRVRVIEATGHGLDFEVDATPPSTALSGPAAAPAAPSQAEPTGSAPGVAFVLRPLLGLGVLGLVFAALFLAWRKKDRPPPPSAGH
jgi:nickel transport protein